MDGWMDGWMDGQMARWTGEWVGGWVDERERRWDKVEKERRILKVD